jgi:phosphatidylserine decarboxylase
MTRSQKIRRLRWPSFLAEDLNFLLTNRIPRAFVTRFIGWYSHIRSPLLARISIQIWKVFTPLDLSEATSTRFSSLHDCFIRELRPGSRPVDPRPTVIVSPCDGIIGEHGVVTAGQLFQAKGFPYSLRDLLIDPALEQQWEGARFITIRITSAMYHRFHAPHDGTLSRIRYISGDTWNVNPIALKRIEKLFCKNERVVLEMNLSGVGMALLMVPIAAILVASIRIHCIETTLTSRTKDGALFIPAARFSKGQELGWFEHGSTILVFAPAALDFAPELQVGSLIRMGQPLLRFKS